MPRSLASYLDIIAAILALSCCFATGYLVFEKDHFNLGPLADALLWISVLAFMVLSVRCLVHRYSQADERLEKQDSGRLL